MRRTTAGLALAAVAFVLFAAAPASAQGDCSRAVVITLPGVTWEEVDRVGAPSLLDAAQNGSAGSLSVRTISSRTSFASGFATLGSGSRVEAGRFTGAHGTDATADPLQEDGFGRNVQVAGLDGIKSDAAAAGYDAAPGALGEALGQIPVYAIGNADTGLPPPAPAGFGRWALLAAMDADGVVDFAATNGLLESSLAPWGVRTNPSALREAVTSALEPECAVIVVAPGDLERADELALATDTPQLAARARALTAADELISDVRSQLDSEDLLMVVSPTSPWSYDEAHLGVAVVEGPGFGGGGALQSASTRRRGLVTLPDVAPTILEHLGLPVHDAMTGRPFFAVDISDDGYTVDKGIEIDRESVFVESMKTPVTAAFVVAQVVIYILAVALIVRRLRAPSDKDARLGRWIELAVLASVAFPLASYLIGIFDQHTVGSPLVYGLLLAIDAALVLPIFFFVPGALDRLLVICALTTIVIFADLLTGARLQINTVFGYSPIVAGRFAGLGNIAFAVLGVASLITGVLLAHRWPGTRRALLLSALVFGAAVVFDGAPQLGSDVGGVLALVPTFALTFILLAGRRVNWRLVILGLVAAVVAVAVFLAVDLSRPSDERTHLARLYEDVQDRGIGVMVDTVQRKAAANIRLFRTSLWTYFVPPALIAIAVLMRGPRGRWERLAAAYPTVRAGLIGGLVLAALGFAVNDSGIVIPAVVLSFLVPMAVIVHLNLDRDPDAGAESPA